MSAYNPSAPIRAGFNDFLASPVGEDRNGMQLSLLSALVRLDLDPWDEAARLAHMPRGSAVKALGDMIARLPAGKWESADAARIAARLVARLPGPDAGGQVSVAQENTWNRLAWPAAICGLLMAVLWILFQRH